MPWKESDHKCHVNGLLTEQEQFKFEVRIMTIKSIVIRSIFIWLIGAAIMLTLLFVLGLGAFLATFFLFHFALTAIPFSSKWASLIMGSAGYHSWESTLKKLQASVSYRILFLSANVAFLALTIYALLFLKFRIV